MTPLIPVLPQMAFCFGLVLCRISALVMLMPGLGEAEPPVMLRAGLSVALTLLVMPLVAPSMPPLPAQPADMLVMVMAELLCGGLLGLLAKLIAMALPIAGQLVSTMVGLSNVLQPDPAMGSQSTGLSRLLSLSVPVLVLTSGLYALPLEALLGSYRLFPPGHFLPVADAAHSVTDAVATCFGLAMRLAAPFIIASVVWQAMLGILARLVPALQVNALTAPAQLLGGLILCAVLMPVLVAAWMMGLRGGFAALPGL